MDVGQQSNFPWNLTSGLDVEIWKEEGERGVKIGALRRTQALIGALLLGFDTIVSRFEESGMLECGI